MKSTTTKQRYLIYFVLFRLFVVLPNSMSKLIYNRFTCRPIIKTKAAYVEANEQLRLCFYFLVPYFLVFDIHL